MDALIPISINDEVAGALHYEFCETADANNHLSSEDELSEHLEYVDKLAALTGGDAERAKKSLAAIARVGGAGYGEHRPSFSSRGSKMSEEFIDESTRNLYLNFYGRRFGTPLE